LNWKIKVSVKPFQRLGAEPALAFSRSSFSVNKIARLASIASYRKQRERMPVMIGAWNAIILVGAADRSAEREIPTYSQIREDRGLGEVPHF